MRKLKVLALMVLVSGSVWGQTRVPNDGESPIYYENAKVGIGTSSPNISLEVKKTSSMSGAWQPNLLLNNGWGGIGSEGIRIHSGKNDMNFDIFSYDHNTQGDEYLGFRVASGNVNDNFNINAQMVLTNDGNVGIGTTKPTADLEIANSSSTAEPGFILNNTYLNYNSLNPEDQRPFVLRRGTNNNESISTFVRDAQTYFVYKNDEYASSINFRLINTDIENSNGSRASDRVVMTIGSYQNHAEVRVDGNFKAEEILVEDIAATNINLAGDLAANNITLTTNGNTADFVFSDSYQLRNLSEVESFIKTNKHLPEIPSATQMEEQGVNLAEMNKLLLQKVEELTLYAIQQEVARKKEQGEREKLNAALSQEQSARSEMEDRLAKLEALLLNAK